MKLIFHLRAKSSLTEKIIQHGLDVVPFTSPSTVDHFMEVIRENGLSMNFLPLLLPVLVLSEKKSRELWFEC